MLDLFSDEVSWQEPLADDASVLMTAILAVA